MFSSQSENCRSLFVEIYDIISLFAAELEEPKIGMWGEGLTIFSPFSLMFSNSSQEGWVDPFLKDKF